MNNALNLFPTTTTPPQTQAKLQKLLQSTTARGPTEIQASLAFSLYDDGVPYMNTLEMNRAASYTFGYRNSYGQNGTTLNTLGGGTHGTSIANEMFELVVDLTLGKYTQHSVLALTKTIHLIQHVLLHGSETCVMNGELLYRIEMVVQPLRNLNTALVEQQMVEHILSNEGRVGAENDIVLTTEGIGQQLAQFGTRATATMIKLRGGSVDQGHPVRMAASKLYGIVSGPNNLRQLRMQQQQPSSLVPIGSTKQVGYITDEGRLQLLQEKMAAEEKTAKQKQYQEEQRLKQTRSNLRGSSVMDSFGGGYASSNGGGNRVVGAAHSLEDMIKTAKYELDQHKNKQKGKLSSMKKGYSDNPMTRAQELDELQRNSVEWDPEFIQKKKALQDALEYLEEMQQLEQEQVGDLLEGDLLGDPSSPGGGISSSGAMMAGDNNAGADFFGFDNNPPPPTDVFGSIASPAMSNNNMVAGGGTADLLGFDGLGGGNSNVVNSGGAFSPQHESMPSTMSGYMGGTNNLESSMNNPAPMGGGIMDANSSFDMRPSLVTGMRGDTVGNPTGQPSMQQQPLSRATPNFSGIDNNVSAMGDMAGVQGNPITYLQPELDEAAKAEKSRKMQMASGLFAGMVPNNDALKTAHQRKPIMQSGNNSNVSALDDLINVSDTALAPSAAVNNSSIFNVNDLNSPTMPPSDPFGMGPMGGDSSMGIPPPPPMAPPPPPMAPPPPPLATNMTPDNAANNSNLGSNQSVEQMQEMIKQQQAQMNQMMQMMQHMQTQGSNNTNNNGAGGWPPSS
eukprot:CAMPEP_0172313868 /NCGR_PEP_ID=MMETSP1058-20130122/21155_1 /TAXON_ID=83371 /ORGANISM="Detonula confervacea, Strain CCMP 353" /LENGTH=788 /DNA_ID=CAMNT_0013027593 /DNA_START=161 /DNA_END=2527 /DNA_ORIENTATION=-